MERIKVLKWEKISLVVPEREDAKIWWKWINDIENQIFLNQRGHIVTLEWEYDYYDSLKNNKNQKIFSIMISEESRVIGNISLMNISEKNRNAEMWILIADKNWQNKWYGTEVVSLILQYGFQVLGLHKIVLYVLWNNDTAKRVYEKCGFKIAGILKEDIWDWDQYIDKIYMEILRKDFFKK